MKKLFALCFLLSAFCLLPNATFAQKQERIKTETAVFTKNYKVNPKDQLVIDTRFTKIVFQEWERNEIEFTSTLKMKIITEKDVKAFAKLSPYLDKTSNQFGKKITYKLNENLDNFKNYEITLLVKMPKEIFINITSSFGNIEMPDVSNDFNATVSFGDLHIKNLLGSKNTINLKHGKLGIGDVNFLSLDAQFATGKLNEVGELQLNSRFSKIEMVRAKSIECTSAHDKISIQHNVDNIKGTMEYGTLKIGSLKNLCVFTKFSFSNITIDKVLDSFTNIYFSSAHSTISLNLPQDQSFAFDYSGSFTKFKDEYVRWNYATYEASNNSVQISGFYGDHRDSGKSVKITASFGTVSLFE